jgi:hypothetical protein
MNTTTTHTSSKTDAKGVTHTVSVELPDELLIPQAGDKFGAIPGRTIAEVKIGVEIYWEDDQWKARPQTTLAGEPVFYLRLDGCERFDYSWRPSDGLSPHDQGKLFGIKADTFTTKPTPSS